jgi:hypothetical protein
MSFEIECAVDFGLYVAECTLLKRNWSFLITLSSRNSNFSLFGIIFSESFHKEFSTLIGLYCSGACGISQHNSFSQLPSCRNAIYCHKSINILAPLQMLSFFISRQAHLLCMALDGEQSRQFQNDS